MALLICSDCQHQVSSKARTCPNCGRRLTRHSKAEIAAAIIGTILIVLAILAMLSLHHTHMQ